MRRRFRTPSTRAGRVLRLVTLLAFITVAVLAVRLVFPGGDPGRQSPRLEEGELGVAEAIGRAPAEPVVIRGYVFKGPRLRELRLCDAREGSGPPRCIGPFVSLHAIDEGAFELRRGEDTEGEVLYSPGPVPISGTLIGTILEVRNVLRGEG